MKSLLALFTLFLSLLAGLLSLASSNQTLPVSLDPLGTSRKQLHLLALLLLLLLHHGLDLLSLAALLLTVVPLLLKLLELMVSLLVLLVALFQLLMVVVELGVVGVQRFSVHFVSRLESSSQLCFFVSVLLGGYLVGDSIFPFIINLNLDNEKK